MDPPVYIKYNRIQLELSEQFIRDTAFSATDWCLHLVVDIGCGPGNTSTRWIDAYFPDVGRLVGIDVDPGMVDLARRGNERGKIEFHVADIMKSEDLQDWMGSVSVVISTFVFHRVPDQKLAFRHVFDLMKPSGGHAALVFIVKGPFYDAFSDLLQTPKWKPILEPTHFRMPESYLKKYDAEDYRQIFEDVGFQVSLCETRPVVFTYETDDECKNLLLSLHAIGAVSDEVKAEYKEALFERFVHHSPRDPQGRPTHKATALYARLDK